MTNEQHLEALKAIKEVNNLKLQQRTKIGKDTVKVEYKYQLIPLNNEMTLILSGSMTQYDFQKQCKTEQLFLVVSLLDNENNELTFTPQQLQEIKKDIRNLITV
jgi:hypothetical protein